MKRIARIQCLVAALLALSQCPTAAPAAEVTLAWDAPTRNEDGTPLADLAGYNVYWGTLSGQYTQSQDVENKTVATLNNLAEGMTYYISVTAYNEAGWESTFADEITWTASDASARQIAGPCYNPGQTLTITNTFRYAGKLQSMEWRMDLPPHWTVVAVSGDGAPVLNGDRISWPHGLPTSPIDMVYTVAIPFWSLRPRHIDAHAAYVPYGAGPAEETIVHANPLSLFVLDADGDGLPDSWERFFGNHSNGLNPAADDDGDGMCNEAECLAGTRPDDPSSVLRLQLLQVDGVDGVALRWASVQGRHYTVYRAPSMNAPFVPVATNLAATPPENSYIDSANTNRAAFYRIRLEP